MTEMVTCSECEEQFDIYLEGFDIDGINLCEHCRFEFTFTCALCDEWELGDNRGRIGSALLVKIGEGDPDIRVTDGVYRITQLPYIGAFLIGDAWIETSSVKRLGDLPDCYSFDFDGYPCAYLCRHCDADVQRKAILFRKHEL